jgi:hypothetical protein
LHIIQYVKNKKGPDAKIFFSSFSGNSGFEVKLSRSVIVSHKLVSFLSILLLLVLFEFVNLLVHPFLESVTHDSPVLMLLALVLIAALLVPLHHRLEKWATAKLVEKNKQVRLRAAKRTIKQLEEGA